MNPFLDTTLSPKIVLGAIAKDESAYLADWIHHHRYFGVDSFLIWINSISDNSICILDKIRRVYPSVRYKVADAELKACLDDSKNGHYQPYAYNSILEEERRSREHTHLLFLDLDEYIIPSDHRSSLKDLICALPEVDVISFQWAIDCVEHDSPPFAPALQASITGMKARLFKSMAKISPKILRAMVHNFPLQNGINTLSDGTKLDAFNTLELNQGITGNLFQDIAPWQKPFSVLHRVNRSQIEYLASLYRGDSHVGRQSVFKKNRNGFMNNSFTSEMHEKVTLVSDHKNIDDYQESRNNFVASTGIESDILEARAGLASKALEALNLIKASPKVRSKFEVQLQNLRFDDDLELAISSYLSSPC